MNSCSLQGPAPLSLKLRDQVDPESGRAAAAGELSESLYGLSAVPIMSHGMPDPGHGHSGLVPVTVKGPWPGVATHRDGKRWHSCELCTAANQCALSWITSGEPVCTAADCAHWRTLWVEVCSVWV